MNHKRIITIRYWFFVVFALLAIVNVIFLILTKNPKRQSILGFQLIQYICFLLVLSFPRILRNKIRLEVPLEIHFTIFIFAFFALILGDAFNFYDIFPWWDTLLHFNSGIILSFIAIWIIKLIMNENSKYIYMNKLFTAIFLVCFSVTLGVIWEIIEYTGDELFNMNTQQYMKSTNGSLVSSDDVPLVGHEALGDTMKDLILDFVGASAVVAYSYSKDTISERKAKKKESN